MSFSREEWNNKLDEDILKESFKNPALFEMLVERHEEAFLRKARSIVKDEEAARDVVQDTFVKIYLYGKGFKPVEGARFTSWAYKILINVCFLYYKKIKKDNEFLSEFSEEIEAVMPYDDKEEKKQASDRDYLESLFSRVPETFARVLRLYVIDGKNYAEIADIEGVSEGAIKTRMHRARGMMKKLAEKIEY